MDPYIFLRAKVYRSMTSGCRGAPYFRRYDRELSFETGDFVEEKLGGGGYRRMTLLGLAITSVGRVARTRMSSKSWFG